MTPTTKTPEEAVPLEELIAVADRFHRSVHLERDWESGSAFDDYVVTSTSRRLARDILTELDEDRGTRAWSLTGPYGSGKSAFALFLMNLLCRGVPWQSEAFNIQEEVDFDKNSFVPVPVVADRSPLEPRLAASIGEAFEGLDADIVSQASGIAGKDDGITGDELAELLNDAAEVARTEGEGGIALVVDEFGKFLEYASEKPEERDLFFLQTLAETAARSDVPVLFLTILHAGFVDYLPTQDQVHRQEWEKIQGRFRDVAFQLPVEQLLGLVGAAIDLDLPEEVEREWLARIQDAAENDALDRVRKRLPVGEVVPDCVPLNPIAALLLWPVFRSKLAQNERSLFAFLTSAEPFGFRDYLKSVEWIPGSQAPPLYDVPRLYDYVENALVLGAFRGQQGRQWAQIDRALGRLPEDAPAVSEEVVKAIGLLSTYGAQIGLDANEEVLALAIEADSDQVAEAVSLLEDWSIIVYRRHRDAYALWEGSDVDIEEKHEKARRAITGRSLATRLRENLEVQPIVARAHYIETGTLRYFDVEIVEAESDRVKAALERSEGSGADGVVAFVVGLEDSREDEFREQVQELTKGEGRDRLKLVGIPRGIAGLDQALVDLEAWRWVRESVPELQSDEVARQEVKARISHARDVVEEKAGEVFGLAGHSFRPELSTWIQGGSLAEARESRSFQRWISELCDDVFDGAPQLKNELLNRQSLSSASTAARRNLIEAMLSAPTEERLSIEGTPAEVSMYESMLRAGEFHRKKGDRWTFTDPGEEWAEVWSFLEEFFEETAQQRRLVTDLFDALRDPPFGLRAGPLPILFLAFVLTHRDEIAFYEDGIYVPEVGIEVLERLVSRPETFEVQSYALEEEQQEVLEALAEKSVDPTTGKSPEAELLPLVKSLVKQASNWNEFTRRTHDLTPVQALSVREALLEATSPLDLLFEDLPEALGVELSEPDAVDEFAEELRDCLLAIHRAYPALLDEIEEGLRQAFDLPDGPSVAAVASLRKRAEPMVDYAVEGRLQVFVRQAARLGNQRDWREVLGTAVQDGKPPHAWSDRDVIDFQVKLQQVASSFARLEELVAERGEREAGGAIYRLGVLRDRFSEHRAVLNLDEEIEGDVAELEEKLLEVLGNGVPRNGKRRKIQLGALARISESLLAPDEDPDTD